MDSPKANSAELLRQVTARIWASDSGKERGTFLGSATLVSDNLAITAMGLFPAKRVGEFLILEFQYRSETRPVSAYVTATDPDLGFAVLQLEPSVSVSLPLDWLWDDVPKPGSDCETILVAEKSLADDFSVGNVGENYTNVFELDGFGQGYDGHFSSGAPVVVNGRLVGIVAMLSSRRNKQEVLGSISIAAIAESRATDVIRRLIRGSQSASEVPQTSSAADWDREGFLARLSVSSRSALAIAEGIRIATSKSKLHMEHLVLGLFDLPDSPTQRLFRAAQLDRPELLKLVMEVAKTSVPETITRIDVTSLSQLSKHAEQALKAAITAADERGERSIHSGLLIYGVFSVRECSLIKALIDRGVRIENLDLTPDLDESVPMPENVPPPQESILGAHPTPKVDSDLWCLSDRLGYEAYARTIASLITNKLTTPPLTIGIKAPWGAGKTSVMKRVQHLLDGDVTVTEQNEMGSRNQKQPAVMTLRDLLNNLKTIAQPKTFRPKPSEEGEKYQIPPRITVWFNAWKYQTSEQIWAGMAHCIISQITARMEMADRELFWLRLHARRIKVEEVRRKVTGLAIRHVVPYVLATVIAAIALVWIAKILLPTIPWAPASSGFIAAIWGTWNTIHEWSKKLGESAADAFRELVREPEYEGKMGFLYLVESDIRDVLDVANITKAAPLIIFVDDLDRCVPHKVAEVVEAINLFLCGDYPNCVFVLGMEPGIVAAALEVANKDVIEKADAMGLRDRAVPVGWRFMEKIVQLPVIIPPPTTAGLEDYVKSLTEGLVSTATNEAQAGNGTTNQTGGHFPGSIDESATRKSADTAKVQSFQAQLASSARADEVIRKSQEMFERVADDERLALAEATKRAYEQMLTDRDPAIRRFIEEIASIVGRNPRQIKRYVNTFRFYSTLRESIRADAAVRRVQAKLPNDILLSKFVALSINWPQAIDCIRISDWGNTRPTGDASSLLSVLEQGSRNLDADETKADSAWESLLATHQLSVGDWIKTRAFRQFMAKGEDLGTMQGCGLW